MKHPWMRKPVVRAAAVLLAAVWLAGALEGAPPAAAKDKKKGKEAAPAFEFAAVPTEELGIQAAAYQGAHAVKLYEEIVADHQAGFETHHVRIKVLSEEGKKHANVELPYVEDVVELDEVLARTVRPDGTVVPFAGTFYERMVAKNKWVKVRAKTFSLPEVEVGSILEYRYKMQVPWFLWLIYPGGWGIQEELPIRRGRYVVRPTHWGPMRLHWSFWLPRGKTLEQQKDGTFQVTLEDVPALSEEEYMPPENEQAVHVRFYYLDRLVYEPQLPGYWKDKGQEAAEWEEEFQKKNKKVKEVLARVTKAGGTAEEKLRKLYQHVQPKGRILVKTEQEIKRKKLKDNKNVDDVIKRGYGTRDDFNRLFVALARGAGLPAWIVRVRSRRHGFFRQNVPVLGQLNTTVVVTRLGEKELYLDPGTPFLPFGALPWDKSDAQGLRLQPNAVDFVRTPMPASGDAAVERTGEFAVDAEGRLQGRLRVAYRGQQALHRRLDALEQDEAESRKELEEDVKERLPAGATVKLETVENWEEVSQPLVAEFSVEVRDFAVVTGRRMLVPAGMFQGQHVHPFEHAQRVHPVYFAYPWLETDELKLAGPAGFEVEAVPEKKTAKASFGEYEIACEKQEGGLVVRRRLRMEQYLFQPTAYTPLRDFFSEVKAGDEQHVVLGTAAVAQQP